MRVRMMNMLATAAALTACGPSQSGSLNSDDDTADASSGSSDDDSGTSLGDTDDTSDESGWGPDTGETGTEDPTGAYCDVFTQDCPEGYKCIPSADPYATGENRCSPVLGDGEPPETCTLAIEGVVFVDDCGAGSFCWDRCQPLCTGSIDGPTCPVGYVCSTSFFAFCVGETCNPLDNMCPSDWACDDLPAPSCKPETDTSFGVAGLGDECEPSNVGDPELYCAQGSTCARDDDLLDCPFSWCCTAWCDPSDPQSCAGQPGTVCNTTVVSPYDIGFCSAP